MKDKPKILVILGPTATGKSDLAVQLALRHNGEIISADSRQVYMGLDIGTGKITQSEMCGIPHHLLDVVSPKKVFSVAEWKLHVDEAIQDILSRGKLPIVCGGTGLYIQAIVDNFILPQVAPDMKLRKNLEQESAAELFSILTTLDPERAQTIEAKNPVRLIRAIEIAKILGTVPKLIKRDNSYHILQIGLTLPETELKERIHARLLSRMKRGLVREAENLHTHGLSWKRMHALGLEYRYLADFLQKKDGNEESELITNIEKGNWDYAKRQMTWFKRDKNIHWFSPEDVGKIEKEVERFLHI